MAPTLKEVAKFFCWHRQTEKVYSDEWAYLCGEYARDICQGCGKVKMRYFYEL